jgi:hypothetical protein
LIIAPASLKNPIKFITCGSIAERKIVVIHDLKTFATIRFSVEVTQKLASISRSHARGFHLILIMLSSTIYSYQIAFNQLR